LLFFDAEFEEPPHAARATTSSNAAAGAFIAGGVACAR